MRDMLKDGAGWLSKMLRENAAQAVTYQRGESTIEVRASRGRREYEVTDASGFITAYESIDWLVDLSDLLIDDIRCEPEQGDRIIEGSLEDGVVYQVMPPPGRAAWEYADAYRNKFRIHTKYVGRQPPLPT